MAATSFLIWTSMDWLQAIHSLRATKNLSQSGSLSINALHACVYIYTWQLRAPRCGLSIWLSSLARFNTLLSLCQLFSRENGQNTKILEVRHFRMIRKWPLTVTEARKALILRESWQERIFLIKLSYSVPSYIQRYCLHPTAGDCGCVLPKLFCVWRHWRGRVQQSDVRTWPFHYCDGMRFSIIYKNPLLLYVHSTKWGELTAATLLWF